MADLFYQGEDIAILMQLFEDEQMESPLSLEEVEVDMLFYTKLGGYEYIASTEAVDGNNQIVRLDANRLSVVIPAVESVNFQPGRLVVEMKVRDLSAATPFTKISVGSAIKIEPSRIGKR